MGSLCGDDRVFFLGEGEDGMKRLMILFLVVACSLLVLLMVGEDEERFHLLARKQSYSIYQSFGDKEIRFSFFASSSASYYLEQEHMVHASIKSETTEEQVSVEIEQISLVEERVFDGKNYVGVKLDVSLLALMDAFEIVYEEARLVILYDNKEKVDINIGEFSYLVGDYADGLRIGEMVATHEEDFGLTVSGLYFDLSHQYQEDILIHSIALGTKQARVNNFYVREVYEGIKYDDSLEDILMIDTYRLVGQAEGDLHVRLRVRESKKLYFPLVYQDEELLLHRFYVKIYYRVGDKEYMDVIDDFPFIRQGEENFLREDYHAYYPRS